MGKRSSAAAFLAIALWMSTIVVPVVHANPFAGHADEVAGVLTNDSLKAMLDGMGYEPKPLSKGYLLALKKETWTINIQVRLSEDLTKVGLNANLGKIEKPADVTTSQWRGLLVSNGDIDPSAFYFSEEQKKLYLHRSFDNRAITPAALRKEIDNFSGNITSTAKLWDFVR